MEWDMEILRWSNEQEDRGTSRTWWWNKKIRKKKQNYISHIITA